MDTYFFDLDGTLTDSRDGLILSFRAAAKAIGAPPQSDDDLAAFLGTPLPVMFRTLVPAIDTVGIETGIAAFRATFEAEGIFVNTLYDGVTDMLGAIADVGARAWVVTSKPHHYAVTIVDRLGLADKVEDVIGAGLDETDTKETLIRDALEKAKARPRMTAMLGDRHHDIEGALANNVRAVGALWGYGDQAELVAAGCRDLCSSPAAFTDRFVHLNAPI